MMALQFVLTTRFKWLKAPYGADIVYHFHRQISFVALALILAHPLLLFTFSPDTLALLLVWSAPWRARAAVTAVIALFAVVGLSVWRKKLKIEYNRWRIWHGIFASAAVAFAMVHVLLVGHYVDLPWKRALWISYGIFWVGLLIYTRLIKPIFLLKRPYLVAEVKQELGNAWSLTLEPVGHKGFQFHPGQFAWITVRHSPFADVEHPFSISSSAEDQGKLTFTIKELGDFTSTIKDLQIGEKVYVDGPFGSFSVNRHSHAQEFVFIAGGVGITPIMSMLRTLVDRRDERKLTLIYANKDWNQITFRDEIEELKRKLNLKIVHVLEIPPENWFGEKGFINQEILLKSLPDFKQRNRMEIFICGPAPMMNAVEKTLDQLGVWAGDFHSERFDFV
jgi:3-phenylpropionate/trans-cinnamate dioxygenase ferredoxin reductase subunit